MKFHSRFAGSSRIPEFLPIVALLLAGFSSPAALQAQSPTIPYGTITLAGAAGSTGSADGTGGTARFAGPSDVALGPNNSFYIADTNNNTVRMVALATRDNITFDPIGVVTALAGVAGASGSSDGTGTAARFDHPTGVAVDLTGNVIVADTDNNVIRKVTPAGVVTTLAGLAGASGSSDGTGSAARFFGPSGIVTDVPGNVYVADTLNHTIRKITPAGVVTTVAGMAGVSGFVDADSNNAGAVARFHGPQGLAIDRNGILFVADTNNNAIRRISIGNGVISTVAGQAGIAGSVDGPNSQAQFNAPSGITVDWDGNLYVADTENHTLREISRSGVVSTLDGLTGTTGSADGVGTAARFNSPIGIAADGNSYLCVADSDNDTIRLVALQSPVVILQEPQAQTVTAGGTVTFAVTAIGGPTLSYNWTSVGFNSSGLLVDKNLGTGRTLTLSNVQKIDAGTYAVSITNGSTTTSSFPVELVVNPADAGGGSSGGGDGGSTGSGGGGGGAPSLGFYGVLGLLAFARRAWASKTP